MKTIEKQTLEQKIDQYQKLKNGDDKLELKNAIFEQAQGLIWKFINTKLGAGHQDSEDVFQDSYIKFERALDKFDASKGFKFSTYLKSWVDNAVFDYHKNKHTVHISKSAWKDNKTMADNAANKVVRLDKPKEHSDGSTSMHELIGESTNFDEDVDKKNVKWFIDNKLKEHERMTIIFLQFKDPVLSLEELSKITNTNRGKIRMIYGMALYKIKQWVKHGKFLDRMEVGKVKGRPIPPMEELERLYEETIKNRRKKK